MKRKIVVWPLYFDSRRSWSEGRRVPKRLAVEKPTLELLARAARAAGYDVEVDPEARHPSCWFESNGRILVTTDEPKTLVLRRIAAKLREIRAIT
ncbi:MAG: hypothetical protein DRJ43_00200 [Thermoprotei archaeon]|nr:MAG: hypothetical protein DRJ43_00200 [Thermoprotei archaeon]